MVSMPMSTSAETAALMSILATPTSSTQAAATTVCWAFSCAKASATRLIARRGRGDIPPASFLSHLWLNDTALRCAPAPGSAVITFNTAKIATCHLLVAGMAEWGILNCERSQSLFIAEKINMSLPLEASQITKRFPGTLALDRAHIELRAGEIHAVLGENGAGKSTLMKIISGVYTADEGQILLEGRPVAPANP